MPSKKIDKQDIFPKGSGKTYGLLELVEGESPITSKEPEDTLFSFPHLLTPIMMCTLVTTIVLVLVSLFLPDPPAYYRKRAGIASIPCYNLSTLRQWIEIRENHLQQKILCSGFS